VPRPSMLRALYIAGSKDSKKNELKESPKMGFIIILNIKRLVTRTHKMFKIILEIRSIFPQLGSYDE
jgi:hypothetical protein